MSYTSFKNKLLQTVDPNIPRKHQHLPGLQIMALCRYLQKVSAIHPSVRYTALWAYLKRNYVLEPWPLDFEIVQRMVHDLEMRRNHTKLLMAEYNAWYKDPVMRKHMKGRCPKHKRKRVLQTINYNIEMLWPTEKGRWTVKSKH